MTVVLRIKLEGRSLQSRETVDNLVNEYGRSLIELCKATGINIMNGPIGATNTYTCYTGKGRSVIDCLLANYLENM